MHISKTTNFTIFTIFISLLFWGLSAMASDTYEEMVEKDKLETQDREREGRKLTGTYNDISGRIDNLVKYQKFNDEKGLCIGERAAFELCKSEQGMDAGYACTPHSNALKVCIDSHMRKCKKLKTEYYYSRSIHNSADAIGNLSMGKVENCAWVHEYERKRVKRCSENKISFEASLSNANYAQCKTTLGNSEDCDWFAKSKAKLNNNREVPKLLGLTGTGAKDKLTKAGLIMKPAGGDPAPEADLSFRVQSQIPKHKVFVKNGSEVEVTFYTEYKEQLVVPLIQGLNASEAKDVLTEKGLLLDPAIEWGDRALTRDEVGIIQSHQPAKGEPIEPGGQVKAKVYYTVVPNVLTKSFKLAKSELDAAWFLVDWKWGETVKNKDMWNTVQTQSLEAGKKKDVTDIKVNLTLYKKPQQEKNPYQHLLGHWEGQNQKINSKIRVVIYLEILSIDPNGILKGNLVTPKQRIRLYNGKGTTMGVSRVVMPVQGSIRGNKVTLSYKIVSGKGKSIGVLDSKNMTIKGENSISSKLLQGGRWHKNKVRFYLKK